MPRRGAYGSLEANSPLVTISSQRASRVFSDSESLPGTPHFLAHGDHGVPNASSMSRGFPWWRVWIIAAAAATAMSATVGVVQLARFTVVSEHRVRSPVPDLAEEADNGIQRGESRSYPLAEAPNMFTPESSNEVEEIATTDNLGELSFIASNEYTRRGDIIGTGYPWLEGEILVEPHRQTKLEVVEPIEGMIYFWNIVEKKEPHARLGDYTGTMVEVMFHLAPQYRVELIEKRSDGTVSRRTAVDIFCKYVRREIRALFDSERDEMFDAMKVLWDLSLEEGKKIYGPKYLDVWTMDEFHQIGASDLNCDHLHDGIGFGITHSMVTLMFEQALQLVNPKLALPYWDFTIDGHLVETLYGGDYSHLRDVSDLWTPEWFGSVDPVDFQVKDGRWGNLTIPIVEQSMRDKLGADIYGRMRSPWNVNDRKYLTRGLGEMCGDDATDFYDWPTCQTHYEMQEMYTSYYGYTWHSQYGPHGPTHIWIGGNFDCKKSMEIVESIVGDDDILHITAFAFIERKNLFRDGLFKCREIAPEDMSAEDVMESGMCGCLDLDLDKEEDYLMIYELFAEGYDFPELTLAQKSQLAYQYCNGVVGIGESSQSSSPLDPTFWSLHPTMERLLMFKRMTGTMTDLSWPDEPGTWVGEDGTEYDVVISLEADECYGHRGSDVFPYGILEDEMTPFFTFWGETGPNTINNRDMVHLFDPRVNALSYIYDSFEWTHCAESGWDFNDLFTEESANQGRSHDSRVQEEQEVAAELGEKTSGKGSSSTVDGYAIFKKGARRQPLYEKKTRAPSKSRTMKPEK